MAHAVKTGFKQKAVSELKAYWLIVFYLWLFFGSFTVYRRLVLAHTDDPTCTTGSPLSKRW